MHVKQAKYFLILIPTFLTAIEKVTHNVRFKIHNKSYGTTRRKWDYRVTLTLLDNTASWNVNNEQNPFALSLLKKKAQNKPYKKFTFEANKLDQTYSYAIDLLKTYIQNEFMDQIINHDANNAQIDIILDMFMPHNNFTQPYHVLYQKIKEFCTHIGITIIEPKKSPWWQFWKRG